MDSYCAFADYVVMSTTSSRESLGLSRERSTVARPNPLCFGVNASAKEGNDLYSSWPL